VIETSSNSSAPPARAALGDEARSPTAWVASTNFAEGLPYSLVHKVASEFLVNANASAQVIGLAGLAHLPWNLKFLWAPLVDRHGSAKGWLVGAQLAMVLAILFLAAFAATFVPWAFAVGILVLAVLAATNDVAVDGYYLRRLEPAAQGKHSGLRIAGYRAAMMVAGGGVVTLGGLYGFSLAFVAAAAIMAGLAVGHGLLLERDRRSSEPGAGARSVAWSAAKRFFARRHVAVALLVIVTYKAGDTLLFAMGAKFLSRLGLDTATRGIVNGTFGTLASIGGSMAGGALIARFRFERCLVPVTITQSVAILLYAWLAAAPAGMPAIVTVVLVEQLVAGAGNSVFAVFLMRLCDGEHKATQFAFVSSMMSLSMTGAGAGAGFLFAALGPKLFFVLAFAASLPGVLGILWARRLRLVG